MAVWLPLDEVLSVAGEPKPIDISDLPDLLRIVEEVRRSRRPRVLRRESEDVAVLVPIASGTTSRARDVEARIWADVGVQDPDAIWANYDPESVRAALRQSAGALAGVDHEALLDDIYEARAQDSPGRPTS